MFVNSFYRAKEHDYEGYFTGYQNDAETAKAKMELDRLMKEVEEKTINYSMLLGKRYNDAFTPISTDVILIYESRQGAVSKFDGVTGFPYNKTTPDDARTINLETKSGDFFMVTGYCYPLGAAIVCKFSYSIPTNNSRVSIKRLYEYIVPLMEPIAFRCELDGSVSRVHTPDGLSRTNATEFIKNFYGIEDRHFKFSLRQMMDYIEKNKCFEVIIRTCDDESLMGTLLGFPSNKACPIHELVGCSKADYKYAQELGVLKDFITLKRNLLTDNYYSSQEFKNALTKTDKEWIEFLEKIKHWEEDLNFYTINYRQNLFSTLVRGYVGREYPFYYTGLPKYYPFGKFCSYVVEEAINQGYTSLETFIKTLSDYIRMCADLSVTPTLYSSYLHQTHDIVARNHKIKLKEEQEIIFAERYKDFKPWVNNEYSIIAPMTSSELQREGDNLNHCVASYIKRVVDGECIIYFLRLVDDISKSLVTLEVRNNAIVQARGLHNRAISSKEHTALAEFCDKRGIMLRV